MTILRAGLELAPVATIKKICALDAQAVSTNESNYVASNCLSYYILMNTWMHMIKQVSEYGWTDCLRYAEQKGLMALIREFDNAAREFTAGVSLSSRLAKAILNDLGQHRFSGVPMDSDKNYFSDERAMALMLLRYPKRFSPVGADRLAEEALNGFVENQSRLKSLQAAPLSRYILSRVKGEISSFLDWDGLTRELELVPLEDIVFTPGVSFDTRSPLVSKLRGIADRAAEYFIQPFGIPLVASVNAKEPEYYGFRGYTSNSPYSYRGDPVLDLGRCEVHLVKPITVPKSYKTARVIAAEDVLRQGYARRFFQICDQRSAHLLDLHDQTVNQELARLGSIDGKLATIDLHAASDSVSTTLFREVFPLKFQDVVMRITPTHFETKKYGRRVMQCIASMGNAMTFWIESIVFLGICRAAVREYNLFTDSADVTVACYGDDIIVPTAAAQTVIEWLEMLGFIVNRDKTFADPNHRYRESCGEEYYEGVSLTSMYYPRFPIVGTLPKVESKTHRRGPEGELIDSIGSLVDLHNKLFRVCVPAARVIEDVLRATMKITSSSPEDGLQDLWAYLPVGKIVLAPGATRAQADSWEGEECDNPYLRELHSSPRGEFASQRSREQDQVLYDLYKYRQFLRYGPRYDDPMLEALGCSAKPISFEEASSSSTVKWRYTSRA